MTTILIVYCHPYNQSFNHAVLDQVIYNLRSKKIPWHLIDLYGEQFNPIYDAKELELFHDGGTHDPQVTAYLHELRTADQLIIITPVWWNSVPAMLKGFIDKVMKEGPGLSHTVTKTGVKGELTNIQRAYVFTTSTSPTLYLKYFSGNAIKKIFINKTLKQLGIGHRTWVNFGGISSSTPVRRSNYLKAIAHYHF